MRRLSLGLALLAQGCEQDCVGAGCLENFGAASALLHSGADLPDAGQAEPSQATLSIRGTTLLGPTWDISIRRDTLLVGSSTDSTVRSYAPVIGDQLVEAESTGTLEGEHSSDDFGHLIRPIAGSDGTMNLLVTAPKVSITPDTRHNGAVYLFTGIGDGWTGELTASEATTRMTGESPGGRLGSALAVCPDIDGDGLEEWMTAATRDSSAEAMSGQIVLALSTDLAEQPNQLGIGALQTRWTGSDLAELAGHSLSCSHDLDGDATPDLLIGTPYADGSADEDAVGAVHLISGAALPEQGALNSLSSPRIQLGEANDWFGWSIATGDIDGDGKNDLAISAPGTAAATGVVYLWSGQQIQDGELGSPVRTLSGVEEGGRFGWSTHIADVNGDGMDDLIIGAPYVNPTGDIDAFDAGRISVYFGGLDLQSWPEAQTALDAPLIYSEPQQYLRTGRRIFSGDFDGDAAADMVFLHLAEGN